MFRTPQATNSRAIQDIADLKTISLYVDDLRDLLNRGLIAERRAFIKSFLKEIKVTGKNAIMDYSIPIAPDKLVLGKEGVPPIVQYRPPYCTVGGTFELVFSLNH
jgi:hypothetical protein